MESLLRNKVLIVLAFLSAYLLYLRTRFKSRRERFGMNLFNKLENFGGPVELMARCHALGTVFITIEKGLGQNTYENNAKYLFDSDLGYENVCKISKIDLCATGNCRTLDLKNFILQYFRELVSRGDILKQRYLLSKYDISPDQEIIMNGANKSNEKELRERLKVFGMMIGLAIIHKVYLEIEFESHFLYSESSKHRLEDLLDSLDALDQDQYILYYNFKNDRYAYDLKLKFVPSSPKPFRDLNDPNPLAREYSLYSYPFYEAAKQIFIDPFKISRSLIFEGMKKVCSVEYYNYPFHSSSSYVVNLNQIFSAYMDTISVYDLKDNVDIDKNSKLFLRAALKHFSDADFKKIYQKATGFKYMPVGGFSRLPRIKIVSGRTKMFQNEFVIVIEPDIDEDQLVKQIRENIKN